MDWMGSTVENNPPVKNETMGWPGLMAGCRSMGVLKMNLPDSVKGLHYFGGANHWMARDLGCFLGWVGLQWQKTPLAEILA
jgi:hypothetical protein